MTTHAVDPLGGTASGLQAILVLVPRTAAAAPVAAGVGRAETNSTGTRSATTSAKTRAGAFVEAVIDLSLPPCTDVAVSGARWMRGKGIRALINTLELWDAVLRYVEWAECPYMIENPVSTISTYWRKPDYTFDPWEYGDLWSKKTCLWTGNGFKMPRPIHLREPDGVDHNRIHHARPGPERANFRSETPMGFARAVFNANAHK